MQNTNDRLPLFEKTNSLLEIRDDETYSNPIASSSKVKSHPYKMTRIKRIKPTSGFNNSDNQNNILSSVKTNDIRRSTSYIKNGYNIDGDIDDDRSNS